MEIPTIPQIAALLVAVFGAIIDLRTGKIPNKLTFPAAVIGILTQAIYMGSTSKFGWLSGALAGVLIGVLGWIVAVLVMSFFKLFMKQFGHGDTKLMAAVGAFVGPGPVLIVWLYYAFTAGIYCIVRVALALPWQQLGLLVVAKRTGTTVPVNLSKVGTILVQQIPFAPFIAAGTLCYVLLTKPTLVFLGFH